MVGPWFKGSRSMLQGKPESFVSFFTWYLSLSVCVSRGSDFCVVFWREGGGSMVSFF